MMKTFRAWVPNRDDGPGDGFDVVTANTADHAAHEAAEYHHRRRDGWEDDWPLVIAIRDEDGRVDYFEVEREMVPEFHEHQVVEKPTRREMQRPPFRIGADDV